MSRSDESPLPRQGIILVLSTFALVFLGSFIATYVFDATPPIAQGNDEPMTADLQYKRSVERRPRITGVDSIWVEVNRQKRLEISKDKVDRVVFECRDTSGTVLARVSKKWPELERNIYEIGPVRFTLDFPQERLAARCALLSAGGVEYASAPVEG